ncbi:MAG: hypothetical protein J6W46_06350 [Spirochaetaceae bacterium]|nr:hypothetical protein [Spirochaetaceae bacterium]
MNYKSFFDKPFRLMSIACLVYLLIMLLLNIFTDFSYEQSLMPFSKTVSYASQGAAVVLCVLTFFFYINHYFLLCCA